MNRAVRVLRPPSVCAAHALSCAASASWVAMRTSSLCRASRDAVGLSPSASTTARTKNAQSGRRSSTRVPSSIRLT